jgi:hypothetical protein
LRSGPGPARCAPTDAILAETANPCPPCPLPLKPHVRAPVRTCAADESHPPRAPPAGSRCKLSRPFEAARKTDFLAHRGSRLTAAGAASSICASLIDRHRGTPIERLIPVLSCRRCQPHPPSVMLLGLSAAKPWDWVRISGPVPCVPGHANILLERHRRGLPGDSSLAFQNHAFSARSLSPPSRAWFAESWHFGVPSGRESQSTISMT